MLSKVQIWIKGLDQCAGGPATALDVTMAHFAQKAKVMGEVQEDRRALGVQDAVGVVARGALVARQNDANQLKM